MMTEEVVSPNGFTTFFIMIGTMIKIIFEIDDLI